MNLSKEAQRTQNGSQSSQRKSAEWVAEITEKMDVTEINKLTEKIIGLAIKIHKKLGPGFAEKIYEKALVHELQKTNVGFSNQTEVAVQYDAVNPVGNRRAKTPVIFLREGIFFSSFSPCRVRHSNGVKLGRQRIDFIIENEIIVELKSTSNIIKIFESQLISYLKASGKRVGLILNFGRKKLEIRRLVNKL